MTYRSRYLANLQIPTVLDLLLTDDTNPRALAYQLDALKNHVLGLPQLSSTPGYSSGPTAGHVDVASRFA